MNTGQRQTRLRLTPALDRELAAEHATGWPRWGETSRRRRRDLLAAVIADATGQPADPPGPYDGRHGQIAADIRALR